MVSSVPGPQGAPQRLASIIIFILGSQVPAKGPLPANLCSPSQLPTHPGIRLNSSSLASSRAAVLPSPPYPPPPSHTHTLSPALHLQMKQKSGKYYTYKVTGLECLASQAELTCFLAPGHVYTAAQGQTTFGCCVQFK